MTDTTISQYLHIVVPGTPRQAGNKRAFRNQHTGRIQMVEASKDAVPWREAIKHQALREHGGYGHAHHRPALDEPVAVAMVFAFARPKSHYRTGRNSHLLKDDAPIRPSGPPDLSKLIRAAEDALTEAAVWRDDARVVEYLRLAKVWAGEDPDGPQIPGVDIRVWRMSVWQAAADLPPPPGTLFDDTRGVPA
jgi:Holliday junction resolvase RusA-like endonuclease